MVEPLFVAEFAKLPNEGDIVELGGAEGKHAAGVRRMRVGEGIQLTNGNGLRVRGEVSEVQSRGLRVRVKTVQNFPAPALAITLIQALAKGDRDELAIQAATEIGITAVIPWESDRSVSRWVGDKKIKGVERWQQIVTEAAKQSLQVNFPLVASSLDSKSLAKIFGSFDLVLVLDPTATKGFDSVEIPALGKIAIVVGPEGGITEAELIEFKSAGAVGLKLGEAILRTSTAGVAALSAIKTLSGQWA
ncbi:MAG: 16S rRNA (uracil(1498)-N(3))-methyltransferase [Rhodoluna sp.]